MGGGGSFSRGKEKKPSVECTRLNFSSVHFVADRAPGDRCDDLRCPEWPLHCDFVTLPGAGRVRAPSSGVRWTSETNRKKETRRQCSVLSLPSLQLPLCGEPRAHGEAARGPSEAIGASRLLPSGHPHVAEASQQRSVTPQGGDKPLCCLGTGSQTRSIHGRDPVFVLRCCVCDSLLPGKDTQSACFIRPHSKP